MPTPSLWAEAQEGWPSGEGVLRCLLHLEWRSFSTSVSSSKAEVCPPWGLWGQQPGLGHIKRSFQSFSASQETRGESSFVSLEAYTISLRERKPHRYRPLEDTRAHVGLWSFRVNPCLRRTSPLTGDRCQLTRAAFLPPPMRSEAVSLTCLSLVWVSG